ncbi:hypothetical protein KY363_07445 [Candidatus Woesearchaeota archaeon]|nr:hypothetical protein [Candidatus Woesearchaeota archaeon]
MLLLLAISLLLLAGCSGTGGFFKGKSETMETYKFRSGTDGLDMKFLDSMPPKQVYVGTDFTTGVEIYNKGAYDIKGNAQVTIGVPDISAFLFKSGDTQSFTLNGKSLYIKDGEKNALMFNMRALCFPGYDGTRASIVTNYTRKIKAKACYYYETTANADVCIDTRKFVRQTTEKVPCKMQDVSLSGGQGGPVGLTKIAPTVIPQGTDKVTVQLAISIKKLKGTDTMIFYPTGGCEIKNQNNVTVEVTMGNRQLQCSPSTIQLKENDAVGTLCKVEVETAQDAFSTPINVNMKYYVQQTLLQDIRVEPPPGSVDCSSIKTVQ